jgi:hypothetical protein
MTRGRSAAQAATPAKAAPAAASGSFALKGIIAQSSLAIVSLPVALRAAQAAKAMVARLAGAYHEHGRIGCGGDASDCGG